MLTPSTSHLQNVSRTQVIAGGGRGQMAEAWLPTAWCCLRPKSS